MMTVPQHDRSVRSIDLNADLAEGAGSDAALLTLVSSANLSCGAHAGSPHTIRQTLREAKRLGVAIGAHPGYADPVHFGRRPQAMTIDQVIRLTFAQVDQLRKICYEFNLEINYIKPHGALYNQAQIESTIALGIVRAAQHCDLALVGPPHSILQEEAKRAGIPFVAEGFPDRRYRPNGTLVPRGQPGALLHDPDDVRDQVVRLVADETIETLCLHGDHPEAIMLAGLVRETLEHVGVRVQSPWSDRDGPPRP